MNHRPLGADVAIVTAADAGYFNLLKGLVLSIRDLEHARGATELVALKVVDLGLTEAQRAELSDLCDILENPGSALTAARGDNPTPFRLARAVKSCIKELFPGFGIYIWIDSDAWVQEWRALEIFAESGRKFGFAIVPELDRAYSCLYDKRSYHFKTNFDWVTEGFGEEVARDLMFRPVLNTGAVAVRADSPLWDLWRSRVSVMFENAKRRVSDQAALNYAVYSEQIPFYPLPSWCNWLCCHARPRLDLESRILTEPMLPFHPIGILHLTETARDRALAVPLSNGQTRSLRLDYLSMRALRAGN